MGSEVKASQSSLTLRNPLDCTVLGILQARILKWVAFLSSRRSSQPRGRTQSPALQVDSLLAEPQEKPRNTGVGSLFLLQGIFLTQESNQGLLNCRQILYQLSYQGSPLMERSLANTFTHDNLHTSTPPIFSPPAGSRVIKPVFKYQLTNVSGHWKLSHLSKLQFPHL